MSCFPPLYHLDARMNGHVLHWVVTDIKNEDKSTFISKSDTVITRARLNAKRLPVRDKKHKAIKGQVEVQNLLASQNDVHKHLEEVLGKKITTREDEFVDWAVKHMSHHAREVRLDHSSPGCDLDATNRDHHVP